MILIAGYSSKLDGIAFVAKTNDHETALTMMRDAWNTQFDDQMKLVIAEQGYFLLREECDPECVHGFEGEPPRNEGFALYAQEFHKGEIIQQCPW